MRAELPVDDRQVIAHRARAQVQVVGDLLHPFATEKPHEDLTLPRREAFR